MIHRHNLERVVNWISIFACTAFLCACGEYSPERLAYGTAIPDARMEIALPEPVTNYSLYKRLQEVAIASGFAVQVGLGLSLEQAKSSNSPTSFQWNAEKGSIQYPYRVSFMLPREIQSPSSFTFVSRKSTTEDFTAKEWLLFQEWQGEILPQAFPEASIKITRHPASFTDFRQIIQISKETGMKIPDRIKAEYDAWLVNEN